MLVHSVSVCAALQLCSKSAGSSTDSSRIPPSSITYHYEWHGLLLQIPGLWELLGAAVVCSTTMLLGWDEKRQHNKQQQQHQLQLEGSESEDEHEADTRHS